MVPSASALQRPFAGKVQAFQADKPAEWFIVERETGGECFALPAEITNTDEFIGLSETALECRVKRSQELVKLKLRTPGKLYTYKVKVERADDVIRRLKCEIVEV